MDKTRWPNSSYRYAETDINSFSLLSELKSGQSSEVPQDQHERLTLQRPTDFHHCPIRTCWRFITIDSECRKKKRKLRRNLLNSRPESSRNPDFPFLYGKKSWLPYLVGIYLEIPFLYRIYFAKKQGLRKRKNSESRARKIPLVLADLSFPLEETQIPSRGLVF